MITLEQFLETQNTGIRQDTYKYKIVKALSLFEKARDDLDKITIKRLRDGDIYNSIEAIPEDLYNHHVYLIEPDYDSNTCCKYLKIVVI